jgi:hypothetical protein
MGLMPQKYPRVKANVWLFCMQVREVRIDGCDLVFLAKWVFLGHQTHYSEATYNLCSDFG